MTNPVPTNYRPTKDEQTARMRTYDRLDDMIQLKNKAMPHFSGPYGERSWLTCIDDSERILNGYTLSRDAQGKEEWQSNMMDNIARAKMRAIAAGVGLKVPEMTSDAMNEDGLHSSVRGEVFKNITRQTYMEGNSSLSAFLEVWHMLSHGIAINYEGYKTGGAKRKKVVSFDSVTGVVETVDEYVKMDGKPFSVLLNPQEFFWADFFIRDVQEQPYVAWVQHYNKMEIELEFSKFKNYKYIKDRAEASKWSQLQNTLFFDKWKSRVQAEDDYEVLRFYSKQDDLYEIWINGIPMLRCPLLWGEKEKMYPFAKQIAEPYANTNFFVGMPFGQLIEAYQEHKNTFINTMIDKAYRSMETPMLVGLGNKDMLDIETKFVNQDNRYYIPDVNQVKPMPINGINQAELVMLQVLDRGIESISIDKAQQGQTTGGGKTAREVVIADQRARELKGLLYLALEDFWYQKTKLRTQIIITHFLKDKASRTGFRDKVITVKDYTFGDGARGILEIHVAKSPAKLLPKAEIEQREIAMEKQGIAYKLISITEDWVDDWQIDFQIVPQAFHNQEQTAREDAFDSEVQWVATLDPEFFVANKDKYLAEKLSFRGKHLEDYKMPPPPAPAAPPGGAPAGAPGQPPGAAPIPGMGATPANPNPETSVLGLQ